MDDDNMQRAEAIGYNLLRQALEEAQPGNPKLALEALSLASATLMATIYRDFPDPTFFQAMRRSRGAFTHNAKLLRQRHKTEKEANV